jgi:probable HAF family extracellular repeat protein
MNMGRPGTSRCGLVLAAFCVASTPLFAATPYQVEDLGTLPGDSASVAMGINESGDVVGWSSGPAGTRAFLYTDEAGMTALPAPTGRPRTHARAVNDTGTVVGTASTGGTDIGHAVRWQSGTAQDLGTLATGMFSEARGVNAAGVAVGSSYTNGGSLLGVHAFRYDDVSGLVDLTPAADDAHAEAINDVDQIAGWRNGRAFRRTGTTFTDLGVPAGFARSFGYAINRFGQVAGHVSTASGNSERIFRYTDGEGLVLLGGNGEFNRAFGINNAGDIVGEGRPILGLEQGFLYTDAGGMQGLNALIDPDAGWFILGAGDINDGGQIAGWASGPQGQRAVRLTPDVGGPPAAPSALAGAVLSPSRIRLDWTDNSGNEAGFTVQRSLVGPRGGGFVVVAQVRANVTTYTDTTFTAGKIYRFRVRACNSAGVSPWSSTIRLHPRR